MTSESMMSSACANFSRLQQEPLRGSLGDATAGPVMPPFWPTWSNDQVDFRVAFSRHCIQHREDILSSRCVQGGEGGGVGATFAAALV